MRKKQSTIDFIEVSNNLTSNNRNIENFGLLNIDFIEVIKQIVNTKKLLILDFIEIITQIFDNSKPSIIDFIEVSNNCTSSNRLIEISTFLIMDFILLK